MGRSLNSKNSRITCDKKFRCKRVSCSRCINFRKRYFLDAGALFASKRGSLVHLIVNWKGDYWQSDVDEAWEILVEAGSELSKALSPRIKFYIRSLGIGPKAHNPHIHFLIKESDFEVFKKVLRKQKKKYIKMNWLKIKVKSPYRLLGYFFDKNFLPTFNMPGRPKCLRILSGSRGISYGFPNRKHLRNLEKGLEATVGNNAPYEGRVVSSARITPPIRNTCLVDDKFTTCGNKLSPLACYCNSSYRGLQDAL